jgi:hypothetical protein
LGRFHAVDIELVRDLLQRSAVVGDMSAQVAGAIIGLSREFCPCWRGMHFGTPTRLKAKIAGLHAAGTRCSNAALGAFADELALFLGYSREQVQPGLPACRPRSAPMNSTRSP